MKLINHHQWEYVLYGDPAIDWAEIDMTTYCESPLSIDALPRKGVGEPCIFVLRTLTRDEISIATEQGRIAYREDLARLEKGLERLEVKSEAIENMLEMLHQRTHWVCKFGVVDIRNFGREIKRERRYGRNVLADEIVRELTIFEKTMIEKEIMRHSILSDDEKKS